MFRHGMRAIHPGEILRNDYLAQSGMPASELAYRLGVRPRRVHRLLRQQSSITASMALRLSRYLDTTPEFWLKLQMAYDLKMAIDLSGESIARSIRPFVYPNDSTC